MTRMRDGYVYAAAAVTYIVAGLAWKALLNWIVGPLWLLVFVWLVPPLLDRIGGTSTR